MDIWRQKAPFSTVQIRQRNHNDTSKASPAGDWNTSCKKTKNLENVVFLMKQFGDIPNLFAPKAAEMVERRLRVHLDRREGQLRAYKIAIKGARTTFIYQ